MRISISVVVSDNRRLLEQCLRSLEEACAGLDCEVLLVDNASCDGSADMVHREFPHVSVVRNERRLGFAANHNINIRRARGDSILVLNDDTVVHPGAIEAMVATMRRHAGCGTVGCRLLNPDGSVQKSVFAFPSPFVTVSAALQLWRVMPWVHALSDYKRWPHDHEAEVPWVSGACFLVLRAAIADAGLLDDHFLIYAEETDWQLRMRRAGWTVWFTPEGTVTHYGGQSSAVLTAGKFRVQHDSLDYYFRKHYGRVGSSIAKAALVIEASCKVCAGVILRDSPAIRRWDPSGSKLLLYRARLQRYLGI